MNFVVIDIFRDRYGLIIEDCFKIVVCFMMNFFIFISFRFFNFNIVMVYFIYWLVWNSK